LATRQRKKSDATGGGVATARGFTMGIGHRRDGKGRALDACAAGMP
jgi:hypothetical protein